MKMKKYLMVSYKEAYIVELENAVEARTWCINHLFTDEEANATYREITSIEDFSENKEEVK
tara:strand:- start:889 stop:1071 length:183 start_codon:yes stop_codon:yes gene_type:complete